MGGAPHLCPHPLADHPLPWGHGTAPDVLAWKPRPVGGPHRRHLNPRSSGCPVLRLLPPQPRPWPRMKGCGEEGEAGKGGGARWGVDRWRSCPWATLIARQSWAPWGVWDPGPPQKKQEPQENPILPQPITSTRAGEADCRPAWPGSTSWSPSPGSIINSSRVAVWKPMVPHPRPRFLQV